MDSGGPVLSGHWFKRGGGGGARRKGDESWHTLQTGAGPQEGAGGSLRPRWLQHRYSPKKEGLQSQGSPHRGRARVLQAPHNSSAGGGVS